MRRENLWNFTKCSNYFGQGCSLEVLFDCGGHRLLIQARKQGTVLDDLVNLDGNSSCVTGVNCRVRWIVVS